MKRRIIGAILVGTSALALSLSKAEAADPANIDRLALARSGGPDEVLERIVTIRDLIHMGLQEKDALPLVTAARLTRRLPIIKARTATKSGATVTGTMPLAEVFDASVKGMLKRAREIAGSDATMAKLIDGVAAMPKTEHVGDVSFNTVAAKGKDEYDITHAAGERAVVYVEAQEEGGYLRLVVLDEGGNTICTAFRQRVNAYCAWTPAKAGKFKVRIENTLERSQEYVLFTN